MNIKNKVNNQKSRQKYQQKDQPTNIRILPMSEAYLEPTQTITMEYFCENC